MSPDKLTPELIAQQLAKMEHYKLMQLRNTPNVDQDYLAPYEHRAFSRELLQEKPYYAPAVAAAIPVWEIAKLLSPTNLGSRSKPSIQSMIQGYKGMGDAFGLPVGD